jgi:translation initiation factor IF-2
MGDYVVVGATYGRVRAMFNHLGKRVKKASLSMPVSVMGLSVVPDAGEFFEVVKSEREARHLTEARKAEAHSTQQQRVRRTVSLEDFFKLRQESGDHTLRLVLKADVQGSLEPIVNSLKELGDDKLQTKILLEGTGNITESDINLAVASDAIVIGFHVDVDPAAQRVAEAEGVDVRQYDVIYKLIDDIDKALQGLLEPEYADKVIGRAEVRAIFKIPRRGNIAGSYVLDGNIARNALARVTRHGQIVHESKFSSLRRFTDDVREVASGFECGIGIDGFNDFNEGDVIEAYIKERVN